MKNRRKGGSKPSVAIVMPNHADINSSLNNYIKTLQYIVKNGWANITFFTDVRNNLEIKGITVKKINGVDYGTFLEKCLLFLGVPRHYYVDLEKELSGFDVIVSNNPEFYGYAYQSFKIAKKNNKRFVLRTSQTVDGFFLYWASKYIVNRLARKAYGYAEWNIFANPEAKERCHRLGLLNGGGKTVITGHATDTKCFRPLSVQKEENMIVLSVGGLLKLKGHQHIMEAVKIIQEKRNSELELWIVGKGPYEKELRKCAESLGISSNVKFLGAKGHEELAKIYNMASVFALANEQEITPAVNEALSCGVPVVVMECGGCSFVIRNGKEGLVSAKGDPQDLSRKMEDLLKDRVKAKKMARKGQERIRKMFAIPVVARKVAHTFMKLV